MRREMGRVATSVGVAVALWLAAVMLPEVAAVRIQVGKGMGNLWTTNVNYTVWAQGWHFYNGDWLYFVYDRNQLSVLEVNETDYESCNSNHPLVNWTTGKGRDVVPLNVTRPYYFISGNGFCFGGAKLAINVENPPPPPVASPVKSGSSYRWFSQSAPCGTHSSGSAKPQKTARGAAFHEINPTVPFVSYKFPLK